MEAVTGASSVVDVDVRLSEHAGCLGVHLVGLTPLGMVGAGLPLTMGHGQTTPWTALPTRTACV